MVLVSSSLITLAGTDLVLPAVPSLPDFLGGSSAQAQYVLAAFSAGSALGLLLYGELGARMDQRKMLMLALMAYTLVSFLASLAEQVNHLIVLRFFQGLSSACAIVVAPGMIRRIFPERQAIRALGIFGSIESLAPAIAPVIGVWLLGLGGWQMSFQVTALLAAVMACAVFAMRSMMPDMATSNAGAEVRRLHTGYVRLLKKRAYMSQSLSHAAIVGAILVFVFGAPTVIVNSMGGSLTDFILMQICGISTFIVCANLSSNLVARYGANIVIWAGTGLSLAGITIVLIYALSGGSNPKMLWALFVPFNMGLGFRGPPAFYQALVATDGDDARGSALLVLFLMLITAAGTALAAPWIEHGLIPLAVAATAIVGLSMALLLLSRPAGSVIVSD